MKNLKKIIEQNYSIVMFIIATLGVLATLIGIFVG